MPHITLQNLFDRFRNRRSQSVTSTGTPAAMPSHAQTRPSPRVVAPAFNSVLNRELQSFLYLPANSTFSSCFPGTRLRNPDFILGLHVIDKRVFQKLHVSLTRKFRSHLARTFSDLPSELPKFVMHSISRHINWLISQLPAPEPTPTRTARPRQPRPQRQPRAAPVFVSAASVTDQVPTPRAASPAPSTSSWTTEATIPAPAPATVLALCPICQQTLFSHTRDPVSHEPLCPVQPSSPSVAPTTHTPSPPPSSPSTSSASSLPDEAIPPLSLLDPSTDHLPLETRSRQALRDVIRRLLNHVSTTEFQLVIDLDAVNPLFEASGYQAFSTARNVMHLQRCDITCTDHTCLRHYFTSVQSSLGNLTFTSEQPLPIVETVRPPLPEPTPVSIPVIVRHDIRLGNSFLNYNNRPLPASIVSDFSSSLPPRPTVELRPTRLARQPTFIPGLHACVLFIPSSATLRFYGSLPHDIPAGMERSVSPALLSALRDHYQN
jgi:hypothetical protein